MTAYRTAAADTLHLAFALGGLAGNNAHGAGFLQAALDTEARPEFISCTSGQILWVYRYLQARTRGKPAAAAAALRNELVRDIDEMERFHQPDLDLITLALFGRASIFRLSSHEYMLDAIRNMMRSFERTLEDWPRVFVLREMLSQLPARTMVPLFNDEFFKSVSDAFNGCHDVGIAFNSYDPIKGVEIVHLNARAQQILGKRPADQSLHRPRTIYAAITPQNVRDGLWVYQYGFDSSSMLDGAFYRQIMLWETRFARDVFVARPIKHSWIGTLPSSYIEMEDVKAEIIFNGAYQGERDKIMLMNRLIEKNLITDPAFHTVDLHEIEMETQETFFDYVFEDVRLFDRAHARGKDALAAYIGDRRAAA